MRKTANNNTKKTVAKSKNSKEKKAETKQKTNFTTTQNENTKKKNITKNKNIKEKKDILKEDKTSGIHALGTNGIYDGSYLYRTWNDNCKAFQSICNNRSGSWKFFTADICSITVNTGCAGCNPGY